jgi:hypothetical protein
MLRDSIGVLRRSMTSRRSADRLSETIDGVVMPLFSFEIAQVGKPPFVAQTQALDDIAAAWCQVEALALAARNWPGASIRVKNADGGIIILTGVATALATLDKCRRPDCPLKNMKGGKSFSALRTLPAKLAQH